MTLDKRIDGHAIAKKILDEVAAQVVELKKTKKVTPRLLVFLIGDNPASRSYIAQKQKAGEAVGAQVDIVELPIATNKKEMETRIKAMNDDRSVHGIIIQRPLPSEAQIPVEVLDKVLPQKDVDGLVPKSPFAAPVARAVISVLEQIFYKNFDTPALDFVAWLRFHTIVVVGKGETAGRPVAKIFETLSVPVIVVDRSTANPDEITKKATILISCVGQPHVIKKSAVGDGVILMSVGLSRTEGKLGGDYDEEEIAKKASFYTPTPGGVGPINVACLLQNLIKACKMNNGNA